MFNQDYKYINNGFQMENDMLNADTKYAFVGKRLAKYYPDHMFKVIDVKDPANIYPFNLLCDNWQVLTPREQKFIINAQRPEDCEDLIDQLCLRIDKIDSYDDLYDD